MSGEFINKNVSTWSMQDNNIMMDEMNEFGASSNLAETILVSCISAHMSEPIHPVTSHISKFAWKLYGLQCKFPIIF